MVVCQLFHSDLVCILSALLLLFHPVLLEKKTNEKKIIIEGNTTSAYYDNNSILATRLKKFSIFDWEIMTRISVTFRCSRSYFNEGHKLRQKLQTILKTIKQII